MKIDQLSIKNSKNILADLRKLYSDCGNYLYIIIVTCPVSGVISLEVPEDVTSKYIFRESSTTDGRNVEEEDRNIV